MSQRTFGRITNYRIGIRSQQPKECLIEFSSIKGSQAGKLVGQKVVWMNGKNSFYGKIKGMHGRNGMVKVRFSHPVPGQAIGSVVELIG